MKLITKAIEAKLRKSPLYSHEGDSNPAIIVKFFNPYGRGTWIVYEAERQADGDWLFFGEVTLFDTEWGYFTLSELQGLRTRWGAPMIERDLYFS